MTDNSEYPLPLGAVDGQTPSLEGLPTGMHLVQIRDPFSTLSISQIQRYTRMSECLNPDHPSGDRLNPSLRILRSQTCEELMKMLLSSKQYLRARAAMDTHNLRNPSNPRQTTGWMELARIEQHISSLNRALDCVMETPCEYLDQDLYRSYLEAMVRHFEVVFDVTSLHLRELQTAEAQLPVISERRED